MSFRFICNAQNKMLVINLIPGLAVSDKASICEQEHEWASLHRGWVLERLFSETTECPELKPLEVVRALFNVVFVPVVLEVKHLVTPEGRSGLRARHQMADKALLTAKLRRLVESKHLEHCGVNRHLSKLLKEVVLPLIRPAIHIVGLNFDLEGPVMIIDLITVLVELRQLHQRHGASVV